MKRRVFLVCLFYCFFRLRIYEAIAAIFWQSTSYVYDLNLRRLGLFRTLGIDIQSFWFVSIFLSFQQWILILFTHF